MRRVFTEITKPQTKEKESTVAWVDDRKPNDYQASSFTLGFVPQPKLQKEKPSAKAQRRQR